jgi:tungstate transport system substrate-binding protein
VKKRRSIGLFCLFLIILSLPFPISARQRNIILATTTSTQDSGLLDELIPNFQKRTGYFIKTIAVGSGQAITLGQRGEADVLLIHSPEAEKKFVAEGYGMNRRIVMHNDYMIAGPKEDPAKIRGTKLASEAFKKLALTNALFLSRGDHSGTHAKERSIWKNAGIHPEDKRWYQQTGLGMGQTLNVAAEKKGYTLADRGTYLALKKNLNLDLLVEGDAILLNVYHVIEVNPNKWPKVNAAGAKAFSEFIVSKEAQEIIKSFGVEKFGSPLFFPDAGKKEEELGK